MKRAATTASTTREADRDRGSPADLQTLLDELLLHLAEAAHHGIILAGGPLSSRKTNWLLIQLTDELGQAEQLVRRLRREV